EAEEPEHRSVAESMRTPENPLNTYLSARTTVHINDRLLNGGVSQPQPCDATNRLGRRMRGAGLPITPSPVGHGHIAPRPPGRVPVREARRQEATRTCLQGPPQVPGRGACGWR